MQFNAKVGKATLSLFAFALSTAAFSTGNVVNAQTTVPTPIIDNFNQAYLKPDHRANWWIINWGNDGNGNQGIYEDWCGTTSCFELLQEGDDRFGRLHLYSSTEAGVFTNVDVSEEHTGYPAEVVNEWEPTETKNVVMTSTVRWSDNQLEDGSGGAIGSSGVWMWNSPYDNANYDPLPGINAFGFNWAKKGTLFGLAEGLKVTVMYQDYPIIIESIPFSVNLQEWNTFKFVWSVENNVESLSVYVNDQFASTYVLPFKLGALSTEIWQDNEDAVFNEFGELEIQYGDVVEDQYFDISRFTLKLQDK